MARRTASPPAEELVASALAAGRRHLEDVGLKAFSLRAVARDIGYAPTSLITWFGSADLMLYRITADALVRWRENIETALAQGAEDPVSALVDVYFDFAIAEPETWKAMYSHETRGAALPTFYGEALAGVTGVVVDFVASALPPKLVGSAPRLANTLLATLRGHCEAALRGSFDLSGGGGLARDEAVNAVVARLAWEKNGSGKKSR